ncbi:MAG: hypothetical protein IPP15_07640 [Saprospiraceae bacterium]|uniref:Uncharacterized protein n=1 Tax=Candidatus Opimibacter skivensis TaxID=2982028 RepID=A0A9D7SUU4_9BACT|nr:hypothetical protein [Candidatus Opimibacter skivensis]
MFCIGIFIMACNSKSTDPSKNDAKETPAEEVKTDKPASQGKEAECYRYFGNKDSIYLQLSEVYGMMTGMLLIKNYQKDQNLGTLQGKMMGDMLLAEYTFKSEGKMSVRQVAFRKKGDAYIEGFGDVQDVNGKTIFKDPKTLKFDESRVFSKVPCKN